MTKGSKTDERGRGLRHFRQTFVSGCFDESFAAQVADSTVSLSPLSLFSHYIMALCFSPPKRALRERNKLMTKVSDESPLPRAWRQQPAWTGARIDPIRSIRVAVRTR
jgi:hypothetical protein